MIRYTLKTWLTAVLLAPVVILSFGILHSTGWDDAFLYLVSGIAAGFTFSVPSATVFGILNYYTAKNARLTNRQRKAALSIAGLALTLLAFLFLNRSSRFDRDEVYFLMVYAAIIVSGVWIYRLEPVITPANADVEKRRKGAEQLFV